MIGPTMVKLISSRTLTWLQIIAWPSTLLKAACILMLQPPLPLKPVHWLPTIALMPPTETKGVSFKIPVPTPTAVGSHPVAEGRLRCSGMMTVSRFGALPGVPFRVTCRVIRECYLSYVALSMYSFAQ